MQNTPNIYFLVSENQNNASFFHKAFFKGESCYIFEAQLTYRAHTCPHCKETDASSIIKWGSKMVSIQLNKVSEYKTILKLKKQRFKCKSCERTFCAECQLTDRHCSISRRVKLAIGAYLDKPMSMTLIAEHLRVSVQTVLRVLRSFRKPVLPEVDALPEVLCLDEFRSGKFAAGEMSCVMMGGRARSVDRRIRRSTIKQSETLFFTLSIRRKKRNSICCF
ncbi:transposase family protein [Enterococcus raffinosus]|uniref:transposase family protein n=1 Tax=Enterococcus raffinosus TaxID=71452 RepID=UPI001C0FBE90|nr:transposase family protein [Enterococcus raffinosus]MBU5362784.1 transposase family protein [Enterococcus raffinosus]